MASIVVAPVTAPAANPGLTSWRSKLTVAVVDMPDRDGGEPGGVIEDIGKARAAKVE